jgi:hypothetical protein
MRGRNKEEKYGIIIIMFRKDSVWFLFLVSSK